MTLSPLSAVVALSCTLLVKREMRNDTLEVKLDGLSIMNRFWNHVKEQGVDSP